MLFNTMKNLLNFIDNIFDPWVIVLLFHLYLNCGVYQ